MAINSTYALVSSGSWVVPQGVSSITVECFGSVLEQYFSASLADAQSARAGASYSKSTNIPVTQGQIFHHNIGANGGITWFNTVNSQPVVGVDTPTTSCLAVGGNTPPASQVAANIGDVKYAGGAGNTSSGTTLSGSGGNAGPNGPGAPSGDPYSNTPYTLMGVDFFIGCGGGANGGSQGGLGVIPYGRTGSGATAGLGAGGYFNGNFLGGTTDVTVTSDYYSNIPQPFTTNYGARGGSYVSVYRNCDCSGFDYSYYGNLGFIVITLNSPTKKSVVFQNNISGSFVLPSDFVSIDSLEAVGIGGLGTGVAGSSGAGGGGGSYAKTFASSISPSLPLLAGSTVVYFRSSTTVGGGLSSWLRIGTNSPPPSTSDGVLAVAGSNAVTNTGGAGGSLASNVGDLRKSGGTGGAGWSSSRYNGGGGGGGAGPNDNGSNGGIGFTTTANRGAGGGGASNNSTAPTSANNGSTTSGGAGVNGLGTGGVGATNSNVAGVGTNGAGSGGAFGTTTGTISPTPSIQIINGIYGITGGQGGNTGNINGRGGNGGGAGVVALTYNTVAGPTSTSTNFFLMF